MRTELLVTIAAMQAEEDGLAAAAAAASADGKGTAEAGAAYVTEQNIFPRAPIGPAAGPSTGMETEPVPHISADADIDAAQPSVKRRRLLDARPGNKNAKMHPRSRYAQHEPDFAALAAKYPGLAEFTTMRPDGRFQVLRKWML